MKNIFLLIWLSTAIGCQNNRTEQQKPTFNHADPTEAATPANPIVNTTIIDKSGGTIHLQYHNEQHMAVLHYKGEPILLHQDTAASGIKYSNEDFEYTEWHGQSTLKHKNKVIFSNP